MGKVYWEGLHRLDPKTQCSPKDASPRIDLDLIHITDDPEEVANGIERHYQRNRILKNF